MKVIVIVGPTSAGKTALSIALAKTIGGEVISADSRQVYRGLNIGSGKVPKREMSAIPHHLLDVASPQRVFNASDYVRLGRPAISEIAGRHHIPIVVGGTGFYIDALLGRVQLAEVPPNKALRAKLETWSLKRLESELKTLDPKRVKTIDTKNRVRLVRAIEIAEANADKRGLDADQRRNKKTERSTLNTDHSYEVLWIGLNLPKENLEKRIRIRLFARIRGIAKEVKNLHAKGLSWKRMEALGLEYRYMARHLQGKLTREEMLAELESEIKKYAKRQMTWFKRNKEIRWFLPSQKHQIIASVKQFLLSHVHMNS